MDEIHADDLIKKDNEMTKKYTIIYEEVLKKCFSKIKITNDIKKLKECVYEIPQIIYGHPKFDISACMIFVMIKLKQNGFKVKQKSDTEIKISWKPKKGSERKKVIEIAESSKEKSKKEKPKKEKREIITLKKPFSF